ncbi:acyl-CoA dehydrogenase family protein [Dietzia sp. ANT_WB102]|uniref:acyl-CoA dehydrogenase family protein n=1 Tax=Dietzia sp. ANT_WB102 TaxID=2597345 RepID=UPI0011ED0AE4|nr:acyl-CoA dehydrogenase family protein [Dietzia sp. ANT_WB102]KAA0919314.1 acyl-CoA dehydrogenase [Dietzia sp. ANT_WB102]
MTAQTTSETTGRASAQPEGLPEFVDAARQWLDTVASPRQSRPWGEGSDAVVVFENWTAEQEREETDRRRAYEQAKFDAGFGAVTWAPEYGGREMPIAYDLAFRRLEADYDLPQRTEMFPVTQQLIAPTIAQWGTPEQRAQYVRAMLRTDVIACQLFSETEAGSDLAAVRTRAVQKDGRWVLNGSKVWTSGARVADYGVAVCRTDADVPKHQGLTVFIVPMDAPGITVRPIQQMTGGTSFNEVLIGDVELDDRYRLGPVGAGWKVALTVLAAERLDSGNLGLDNADQAVELARNIGRELDALERDTVADLVCRSFVQRLVGMRVAAAVGAGREPGPEASVGKLLATDTMARTSETVRALLGPDLTLRGDRWGTWAWTEHVLGAPGYRIAGGTDEIQRNILAERVLGLPRELRP